MACERHENSNKDNAMVYKDVRRMSEAMGKKSKMNEIRNFQKLSCSSFF